MKTIQAILVLGMVVSTSGCGLGSDECSLGAAWCEGDDVMACVKGDGFWAHAYSAVQKECLPGQCIENEYGTSASCQLSRELCPAEDWRYVCVGMIAARCNGAREVIDPRDCASEFEAGDGPPFESCVASQVVDYAYCAYAAGSCEPDLVTRCHVFADGTVGFIRCNHGVWNEAVVCEKGCATDAEYRARCAE